MPTGIDVVDGIIIAVTIQVQTIDGFGGQVGSVIGGDKSAPFGGVIPGVQVIQAGIVIVVIATITNGVGFCQSIVGSFRGNRTITPGVVQILSYESAAGIINADDISQQVPLEIIAVSGACTCILSVFLLSVNKK